MSKLMYFIRNQEPLLIFLSAIYRLLGFNHIKGKKGLKIYWNGVFARKTQIINHGKDNVIEISKGNRLSNCKIQIFGDKNKIFIENDCVGNEVDIWISDGSSIKIGNHTHFTGKIHFACIEGKTIHIGSRCLFSNEITFRTGDSHSIINKEGQRINPAADIYVGDHVWIGQQVVVLKGAKISDESVVGTRSLVSGKEFESGIVLAGSPAKVIKRDITWHHELL